MQQGRGGTAYPAVFMLSWDDVPFLNPASKTEIVSAVYGEEQVVCLLKGQWFDPRILPSVRRGVLGPDMVSFLWRAGWLLAP